MDVTGVVRRIVPPWRLRPPDDPGLEALRRAARVALVMPAASGMGLLVLRNAPFSTFIAFGSFSLLALADFGGLRRPRAIAYASATVGGAALVVIGTLASTSPWIAALVTLFVAFAIRFAGLFGGYAMTAQVALLLSFVLSVAVPAPPAALGPRVAGWITAGIVAGLAGVLLWPRFEHLQLMDRAASACRALAQLVDANRQRRATVEIPPQRKQAIAEVAALRQEHRATPIRPAWPARRDRALAELITEIAAILEIATNPFSRPPDAPPLPLNHPRLEEGDRLASALVETLQASAGVLTGGPPPDPSRLWAARSAHRRALNDWARDAMRSGTPPQDVLEGLAADDTLSVISYPTLGLAQNAIIAAGRELPSETPPPSGGPQPEGFKGVLFGIWEAVQAHLEPRSVVLHDSVRAAVGIAVAVLISRLLRLDYGFWVVLGTLSVLRSSALGTARTTVEALIGTLAGFAAGALIALLVGTNAALAWAILPLVAFTAAYASTAIGFVVGQAAFTVFVIVLFNLISPVGWRIGLVRIEDVAIGVGISLLVALLLWPRGARRDLARAVAGLYRSVADFLAASLGVLLGKASLESALRARTVAVRARDGANEALRQFLSDRSAKAVDPERAAFLVASGKHAILFGDAIEVPHEMDYRAGPTLDGIDALYVQREILIAGLEQLACLLDGHGDPDSSSTVERVSHEVLRDSALKCLRQWADDPSVERPAVAAVVAVEWMNLLDRLVGHLEDPVAEAARAARVPWWR
jgi:uncharacterized membrane protein YccC